ncbi:MAG: hypothetical protein COA36_01405 [Desulfotalea sp.]|nr:MAG: hypothetical protein COA36_01405 [Desulfotalea sp.]
MKSISIIGATFEGNRGAEAMLTTTIAKLRTSHSSGDMAFNIFSYYPERDRKLVDDSLISIYSSTPMYLVLVLLPCSILHKLLQVLRLTFLQKLLPQSVQALASSSALVCLAGVSFIDGREKFLPFNVATILPALLLGVPVIKFAQAMGPFTNLVNRIIAKVFLGRCRQIFTRGEKTNSHLQTLFGEKVNYQRADDIAFLFEGEFSLSAPGSEFDETLYELQQYRKSGKCIIGVCPSIVVAVRSEATGGDYILRMQELIAELVDRGYSVALYPNATRGEDMDKTHNNDLPLLDSILQGLDSETKRNVLAFTGSLNAKQIHCIVKNCDVHSVSRFHAMVAALASSIPVMVVGWSHKYLEVMECFSQQDMVLDYKDGSVEPIIACIEQLLAERKLRSDQIAAELPCVKQMSIRQIQYVLELVENES